MIMAVHLEFISKCTAVFNIGNLKDLIKYKI